MFRRFTDELTIILFVEFILHIISTQINRTILSKILNICIRIIIYNYIYSFVAWYSCIITIVEIIILNRSNFTKSKQLSWCGCYSGKYQDLVKSKKIIDSCKMCAITFEDFSPTTQIVALKCRHAFTDNELIHKWLNIHRSCPTCRRTV
jgi:hypothetical protein